MVITIVALMIPIVAVICVFAFLTVMIVMRYNNQRREREKLYDVAMAAVERGQPLPPEVISALATAPSLSRTAHSELRGGVVCLAVGIGLSLLGLAIDVRPLVGVGAIPGLIGLALIALSFFNPNKGQS